MCKPFFQCLSKPFGSLTCTRSIEKFKLIVEENVRENLINFPRKCQVYR